MSIVFLNDSFMPMEEAKISPMDRGFLFGDGIYEVIPSYNGRMVGFALHIQRMQSGLREIGIGLAWSEDKWRTLCENLINQNGGGNLGLYLHVSRGADSKRFHAYADTLTPTVFAFAYPIPNPPVADKTQVAGYKVSTARDLRWQRCHIKSTALLGNVMHFQQGFERGAQETLLFNINNELTEASSSNVFIVKDGVVITPPLDHQLLPGITRYILLDILRRDGAIDVEERTVTKDEVLGADEVWVTSSSKEVMPVIEIDRQPVGANGIGDVWLAAQTLYSRDKYRY
jgi:D-alanine transaminase